MRIESVISVSLGVLSSLVNCDEAKPETIYLPYSETEDVDFTIARPNNIGCYQWMTENEDVIELIPVHSNYELQCGTKLEIKIIPKSADPKGPLTITIEAFNVDIAYETAVQQVEYTLVVVPVARLEVVSEKENIKANDDPVMFGVAAYDAEGNEFDTIDGVTLSWFIGAKRDIGKFHGTQTGPVVYVQPTGGGVLTVICVISDKFYDDLEPGSLDATITSQLGLQPDGVYLLTGAEANLTLLEKLGSKEDPILKVIPWDLTDFTVASREEDIAKVDMNRKVVIGGVPDDETSLLIKDGEGTIIKGIPIRTASPHKMEIKAHPYPESRQLIVGQEYNITTTIFDKEGHEIFPSENILMKTTFGKQFDVLDITVNGVLAKVVPEFVGVAKIRASLRSTLTPEDEETEIEPHVKATTDFEIYESVLMTPSKTILPWDTSMDKLNYELTYKITGGGKVYKLHVDKESMAELAGEEKVRILSGPGTVVVTAGMSSSMHNNATARVHLTQPTRMEVVEFAVEWEVGQTINIPVAFYTIDPDTGDEVVYMDCADLGYEVTLSNNKDFTVGERRTRGSHTHRGSCVVVDVIGNVAGASTKVTVSYKLPGSNKEFKQSTQVSTFSKMNCVLPPPTRQGHPPQVVLPVGSSKDLLMEGGPIPWPGKPSNFFREVISVDENIVRARLLDEPDQPHHGAVVSCVKLGEADVEVVVGNKPSSTNKKPTIQRKAVKVICSEPGKISKVDIENLNVNMIQIKSPIVNKKTNRLMTYSYRDFLVRATVKDKEGRTFDNTTSLEFRVTLSDDTMATVGPAQKYPFQYHFIDKRSSAIKIPIRESRRIFPNGVNGDLDIQMAVVGYNHEVLESVGAELPLEKIPAPPEPFKEDEDEDYDYDEDGNFIVLGSSGGGGLAEEISLTLATDPQIDAQFDALKI